MKPKRTQCLSPLDKGIWTHSFGCDRVSGFALEFVLLFPILSVGQQLFLKRLGALIKKEWGVTPEKIELEKKETEKEQQQEIFDWTKNGQTDKERWTEVNKQFLPARNNELKMWQSYDHQPLSCF